MMVMCKLFWMLLSIKSSSPVKNGFGDIVSMRVSRRAGSYAFQVVSRSPCNYPILHQTPGVER